MKALQVRKIGIDVYDLFSEPKFFGNLEGGTIFMVVSSLGECYMYPVSQLDGYKTLTIESEYIHMYSFIL